VLGGFTTSFRSGYAITRRSFENLWLYEHPNQRVGFLWYFLTMPGRSLGFFAALGFLFSLFAVFASFLTPHARTGLWLPIVAILKIALPVYGAAWLLGQLSQFLLGWHVGQSEAAFAAAGGRGYGLPEPEMVPVPAGEFVMGDQDEPPAHRVMLPEFWIAKYPVTNLEYKRFELATGHRSYHERPHVGSEKNHHPVTMVSYSDAHAYCDWLSSVVGKKYRLPTEAKWEKAARGADGREWPWGNVWDPAKTNTEYLSLEFKRV
jgi:hypothetical protein